MHKLKVKEKYYKLLKSGDKTIELRLLDEKRQAIKPGDIIEFTNNSDPRENFIARIIKLHCARSFAELCQKIPCQKAGFENNGKLISALEEFYPQEKQTEFGVIGIEIKLI